MFLVFPVPLFALIPTLKGLGFPAHCLPTPVGQRIVYHFCRLTVKSPISHAMRAYSHAGDTWGLLPTSMYPSSNPPSQNRTRPLKFPLWRVLAFLVSLYGGNALKRRVYPFSLLYGLSLPPKPLSPAKVILFISRLYTFLLIYPFYSITLNVYKNKKHNRHRTRTHAHTRARTRKSILSTTESILKNRLI